MIFSRAFAAALALGFVGAAHATSYDLVSSFSTTSPVGVFSYGTGVTGTSFTPYTNSSDCLGSGTFCWQTATPVDLVPTVAGNLSGSTVNFGTVVFPTDVLLVHPGPSTDSIVRFTAPTSGEYEISGFAELLDTNPTGVLLEAYLNGVSLGSYALTGPGATHPDTPGESVSFGGTYYLSAGSTLDFGVNNAGDFYNDSTGVSETITAVPEPAAWALMLVGVGSLGAALRRRKALAGV